MYIHLDTSLLITFMCGMLIHIWIELRLVGGRFLVCGWPIAFAQCKTAPNNQNSTMKWETKRRPPGHVLFAGSLNAERPTANSQRVACVCHHTENGANLHTYSISPNKLDLAMQNANASLSGLLNMDGGGCVWYVSAGAYLFVSLLLSLTPKMMAKYSYM